MSDVRAQSLSDQYAKTAFIQSCQKLQGQALIADEEMVAEKKIAMLRDRVQGCECLYGRAVAGGTSQEQVLKMVAELNAPPTQEREIKEPLMGKLMNDPRFGGACGLFPFGK